MLLISEVAGDWGFRLIASDACGFYSDESLIVIVESVRTRIAGEVCLTGREYILCNAGVLVIIYSALPKSEACSGGDMSLSRRTTDERVWGMA